jgi:hypothetical protein
MSNIARLTIILLAALCIAGSGELSAERGISRCIDAIGTPVFTDRSCSSLGAREFDALPDVPPPLVLPSLVHGCSRQVDMLETWLRAALESGDINHLAGLYHWADATSHTVDSVLPGLQELIRYPLIDIETESAYFDGVYRPFRMWLDQHHPEHPDKTIRTGFFLVMNAGCWWLHSY